MEDHAKKYKRHWAAYSCFSCGGVVLAVAPASTNIISKMWPEPQSVDAAVPGRSRDFLNQAIASLHAPSGAVMIAASAVDSMLKAKDYSEGSLYSRIDTAAGEHLITKEMAQWAHEVRLGANNQRHADEEAPMPTQDEVEKVIEFAQALAQFLFVLPARVAHGREQ